MTTPLKHWESSNALENKGQILRSSQLPGSSGLRAAPPSLPPRPQTMSSYGGYNSGMSPYSSIGNSYNYGSMGWPGRSLYGGGYGNGYGGYAGYANSYGMYGNGYMGGMGGMGPRDDAESRFIQYAEESSRSTFANVESIVRAFNGIAMMLDSTFFAMTSSFRAVLGVAENFGRLRSMFGHIWQAVNVFRLFSWLHRKLSALLGVKLSPSVNNAAWNEAVSGVTSEVAGSSGSSWPTLAFFGVLFSAPYIISKLLPKYEDKCDPQKWIANGIAAKAVFDFSATSPNELTLHTNDEILLAPKPVQEEMRLSNTGWAYATCNGGSGVVPLNYIVIVKKVLTPNFNSTPTNSQPAPIKSNLVGSTTSSTALTPVSVLSNSNTPRKVQKRVSFGETQIFEPDSTLFEQSPIITQQKNTAQENQHTVKVVDDTVKQMQGTNSTENKRMQEAKATENKQMQEANTTENKQMLEANATENKQMEGTTAIHNNVDSFAPALLPEMCIESIYNESIPEVKIIAQNGCKDVKPLEITPESDSLIRQNKSE